MKGFKRIVSSVLALSLLLSACANPTQKNTEKETAGGEISTAQISKEGWQKGLYKGENVTPSNMSNFSRIDEMKQLADGKILAYDVYASVKYESADNGKTWQTSDGPGKQFMPEKQEDIYTQNIEMLSSPTLTDSGVLYTVLSNNQFGRPSAEVKPVQIKKVMPDGTMSDVYIKEIDELNQAGESVTIRGIKAVAEDKIYIEILYGAEYETDGDGGCFQINEDTRTYAVYSTETGERLYDLSERINHDNLLRSLSDGQNLYYLTKLGEIVVLSVESGEETNRFAIDFGDYNDYGDILSLSAKGELQIVNSSGIYAVDKASGAIEQKVKGSKMILGNPDFSAQRSVSLGNEEYLLYGNQDGEQQFWRVSFDAEAEYDPNAVLDIWSLYESESLKYLASDFLQKHPEADVNIEAAIFARDKGDEVTPAEKEDAIKQLNTRLLTGEAPDIILLDKTPAEKYAKEGLLLNLEDKVDTSDVYGTFVNQLKKENGLFYLPITFSFSTLVTDDEEVLKLDSFDKLIEAIQNSPEFDTDDFYEHPEIYLDPSKTQPEQNQEGPMSSYRDPVYYLLPEKKPLLISNSFQTIYDTFWAINEPQIIKDSKIDEENLKKLISAVKITAEKTKIFEYAEANQREGYDPFEYWEDDKYGSLYTSAAAISASDYDENISRAKIAGISRMSDFKSISDGVVSYEYDGMQILHPEEKFTAPPAMTDGMIWYPEQILSVSSQSKLPELAAAFIQNALSTDIQAKLGKYQILPIVKSAIPKMVENAKIEFERMEQEQSTDVSQVKVTFAPVVDMEALTEKMITPVIKDNVVRKASYPAVLAYCQGTKSLEETIAEIHNQTRIYLGEKAQ